VKVPFIPYKTQERRFRAFLAEYAGLSRAEIRKEAVEDNVYLSSDLTYTQLQEIFDAGWEAAEASIKRCKA
jgi:hypothetical protein